MNDVEIQSGVFDPGGDWNEESLVPAREGVALLVGFGGELEGGIDPSHDVRLQRAVTPVHVLEVFGGGDGQLQLVAIRHGNGVDPKITAEMIGLSMKNR